MTIEFVNHACYILRASGVSLMVDPWLEGRAFHNGWALIAETEFAYERFSEVTHIWFSHEHPDHFSPPNLKKIPEAERKRIVVLFQQTQDRKVVDYCSSIGFENIVELEPEWVNIAADFRVLNRTHTDGDSWLCVEAEGKNVLNVNDCNLETDHEVRDILRAIGSSPDLLFTQFSYANSIGNREDTAMRAVFARAKIEEIHRQIRILEPKYVIPFASFVWFCHSENFFRNDAINTIDVAYEEIWNTLAKPIILFNGDSWELDAMHDSSEAIAKWTAAYQKRINIASAMQPKSIPPDELLAEAKLFAKRLSAKNSAVIKLWLEPTYIYVYDLNASYRLNMNGLKEVSRTEQQCDISIGSEALHYCFKYEWGGSTTRINGRYEVPVGGKFERFKRYFLISQLNNQGLSLGILHAGKHIKNTLRRKFLAQRQEP